MNNKIKRYDPNDNTAGRQFVGMDEQEFGDWVKFDDVESSLNFTQQLLKGALEEFKDNKFNLGVFMLVKAISQLKHILK